MTDLKARYSELVALTQLFLLREFPLQGNVIVDPQTLNFFNKLSSTSQSQVKPKVESLLVNEAPTPKNSLSSPPLISKDLKIPKNPVTPLVPKQSQPEVKIEAEKPLLSPQAVNKEESSKSKSGLRAFHLEPMAPTTPIECQDFRSILQKLLPSNELFNHISSDLQAKKIKNAWQLEQVIPPILILAFNDHDKHLTFLKNVAKAITACLAPARVISGLKFEQEKCWEQVLSTSGLRLIIASDYGLYGLPELMKHYREAPRQAKHFLKQIPLLLLSDLSLYLKETQLKPLLWRAIRTEFEASRPS